MKKFAYITKLVIFYIYPFQNYLQVTIKLQKPLEWIWIFSHKKLDNLTLYILLSIFLLFLQKWLFFISTCVPRASGIMLCCSREKCQRIFYSKNDLKWNLYTNGWTTYEFTCLNLQSYIQAHIELHEYTV